MVSATGGIYIYTPSIYQGIYICHTCVEKKSPTLCQFCASKNLAPNSSLHVQRRWLEIGLRVHSKCEAVAGAARQRMHPYHQRSLSKEQKNVQVYTSVASFSFAPERGRRGSVNKCQSYFMFVDASLLASRWRPWWFRVVLTFPFRTLDRRHAGR